MTLRFSQETPNEAFHLTGPAQLDGEKSLSLQPARQVNWYGKQREGITCLFSELLMKPQLMMFVGVGLLIAANASQEDMAKQDVMKLQGTWTLVMAERDGKKVPKESIGKVRLLIMGKKLTLKSGDDSIEGTFEIDPTKKPKAFDSTIQLDGDSGKSLGIYELEGDTLRLCAAFNGKKRPEQFGTKSNDGVTVWTYQRVKP